MIEARVQMLPGYVEEQPHSLVSEDSTLSLLEHNLFEELSAADLDAPTTTSTEVEETDMDVEDESSPEYILFQSEAYHSQTTQSLI